MLLTTSIKEKGMVGAPLPAAGLSHPDPNLRGFGLAPLLQLTNVQLLLRKEPERSSSWTKWGENLGGLYLPVLRLLSLRQTKTIKAN